MTKTLTPPLKWHGGKHYLAKRIIELMPPHTHYVEPYAGGLSVLLAKEPKGVSEVVNDLNCELTNFWCAIQNDECFAQLKRRIEAVPFSETEWQGAGGSPELQWDKLGGMTALAVNFFIRCRQSLAGRMKDFAPLSRTRTRRGMNEQASAWLTTIEGLPAVHARLKRVVILNRDALAVIRQQDGPDTLFYCDPPYLHETRASTGEYEHEMTADQHQSLLETIACSKRTGKFLLSGYRSTLYDRILSNWNRREFNLPNNSAGGKTKRRMVECVWTNF